MSDLNDAHQDLVEFMFTALDHGVDSIKNSGGPLIPFILTSINGDKKLQRFVTKRIEEGQTLAKEYLLNMSPEPYFAVITYDGYVTIEGEKFDSVMIEGYDKNDDSVYLLAQRYKPKKLLKKFSLIGNPAFIGTTIKNDKELSED